MITAETVALEKTIRRATYKMGTFGCSIKDGTLDIQHMFFVHKTQRLEAATCWCAEESRHRSWIRFSSIYSMPDLLPFLLRSSVRYFIDFSETRIRFYGIILS